jgi:hypothetical protein
MPRRLFGMSSWAVDVEFPSGNSEMIEDRIKELCGRPDYSAKSFGFRDMQYLRRRRRQADDLAAVIRRIVGTTGDGRHVSVYQESGFRPAARRYVIRS